MPRKPKITAAARPQKLLAVSAPVELQAAAEDGSSTGPRTFISTFYTGGKLVVANWDLPVVVDLSGLQTSNVLVANLDHDSTHRVGTFEVQNDGTKLVAIGKANAATPWRDEVVNSAMDGYQWQASLEVSPHAGKVEKLAKDKTTVVNGQTITGPAYITRSSTLTGFAFVSHGADDNTTATIAATAAHSQKGTDMDPEIKAWIEKMGFDVESLSDAQLAGLEASYKGKPAPKQAPNITAGFEAVKAEKKRVDEITEYALAKCEDQPHNIDAIRQLADQAIEGKWSIDKFRLELLEASAPQGVSPFIRARHDDRLSACVLEAAVCAAGRLDNIEKTFDADTLQAAHDRFPHGIGLNELVLLGAQSNGYSARYTSRVTIEAQRAAFGMQAPNQIRAQGWSTINVATILSNVANKFLRRGWDMVDMTPLRIAAIRPVRDFKTVTTVSLTGDTEFRKVGASGEITHGTLGEEVYSNKADTYARMLAITRQDFINDDLGALTEAPRKLGRGGGLMLNKIFWTKFLNNSAFFTTQRKNVNEGVANMTVGGLAATETIFKQQVDPDGNPLGVSPAILLVPTPLHSAARTLMTSERLIDGTSTNAQGDANIFRGRFRVETSPYMENTLYTGNSPAAWYMLADPNDMPVIEIVALYGRVEPVIETADADFNVLGVQMRGYSDVGVELQEYRGGVRADGGES